jgi:hypothetical protein
MWFQRTRASDAGRVSETPKAPVAERRRRYEPAAAYALAASLRRRGIDLASGTGPWRVVARHLGRAGRHGLGVLPIVTNGLAQLMVDTMDHAADLAGLLNWSGVDDLDPVPDLVPPPALRYPMALG